MRKTKKRVHLTEYVYKVCVYVCVCVRVFRFRINGDPKKIILLSILTANFDTLAAIASVNERCINVAARFESIF